MNLLQPRHTRFSMVALAFLFAAPALLPAQSVRAESAQVIEEVVVTARKREESLQEVPVVVTVLTEDVIENQRIEAINDLSRIVPGLHTSRQLSGTTGNVYLRGVGTGSSTPLVDQAVAINLEGVGINNVQLMNAGMMDLRQIEVLRGPQALFYGKNSPGGVIAIHTNDPTDELEVELTAAYETETEEPTLRAIVSGPLSETLGARLSLGWSDADRHAFDIINFDRFETGPTGDLIQTAFATGKHPVSTETFYGMGTLLWEPTDNFSAKLKVALMEDEADGSGYYSSHRTSCPHGGVPQANYPVPGIDNCKAGKKVIAPGISPALLDAIAMFPNHRGDGFWNSKSEFAVLEINYEMHNDLTLTSVTGYLDGLEERLGDATWQVSSGILAGVTYTLEQWSQELRLSSNYAGPVNFTVGAFYEDREIYNDSDVRVLSNHAGLPVSVFGQFVIDAGRQKAWQEGVAYSVFAQLDWSINEKTSLAAGGRYSYEEKGNDTSVTFGGVETIVPILEENPDWNNFSPEVSLSYELNDDAMLFANYKTAFKSGGYDGGYEPGLLLGLALAGIPDDNVYDEEEVSGFEVGLKSTLLDGTLRFNVTAYRFEYEDLQLSKFAGGAGVEGFSLRVINAAEATLEGVELETFWITLVEGLALMANIAWANPEYDDYIADCFVGQTVALGCDQNLDPDSGRFTGADMSGEALPLASELSATFGLDYMVRIGSHWNLAFNVTASYKDEYNPSSEKYPKDYWQDSYWLTNASVSLYSGDDKWELYARGVNLAGEFYGGSGSNTPFTGNGALTGSTDPSGLSDILQFIEGGRQITLGVTYRM